MTEGVQRKRPGMDRQPRNSLDRCFDRQFETSFPQGAARDEGTYWSDYVQGFENIVERGPASSFRRSLITARVCSLDWSEAVALLFQHRAHFEITDLLILFGADAATTDEFKSPTLITEAQAVAEVCWPRTFLENGGRRGERRGRSRCLSRPTR